jgi:hypothetical protein
MQDTATRRNRGAKRGGIFSCPTTTNSPPNNGAILTVATIIKAVMSLAAEAELGALYLNAKEAAYLQKILTEMGHPQPQTPIRTNNLTAEGVINHKIQPRQTKAIDMRFHWLRSAKPKANFEFTGNQENSTVRIILQNTTHHCTMLISGMNFC